MVVIIDYLSKIIGQTADPKVVEVGSCCGDPLMNALKNRIAEPWIVSFHHQRSTPPGRGEIRRLDSNALHMHGEYALANAHVVYAQTVPFTRNPNGHGIPDGIYKTVRSVPPRFRRTERDVMNSAFQTVRPGGDVVWFAPPLWTWTRDNMAALAKAHELALHTEEDIATVERDSDGRVRGYTVVGPERIHAYRVTKPID